MNPSRFARLFLGLLLASLPGTAAAGPWDMLMQGNRGGDRPSGNQAQVGRVGLPGGGDLRAHAQQARQIQNFAETPVSRGGLGLQRGSYDVTSEGGQTAIVPKGGTTIAVGAKTWVNTPAGPRVQRTGTVAIPVEATGDVKFFVSPQSLSNGVAHGLAVTGSTALNSGAQLGRINPGGGGRPPNQGGVYVTVRPPQSAAQLPATLVYSPIGSPPAAGLIRAGIDAGNGEAAAALIRSVLPGVGPAAPAPPAKPVPIIAAPAAAAPITPR